MDEGREHVKPRRMDELEGQGQHDLRRRRALEVHQEGAGIEEALEVLHVDRECEEAEGHGAVQPLPPVMRLDLLRLAQAQDGERGVRVLVEDVVVAIRMVRDLVVVAPHDRRAARDDVVQQPEAVAARGVGDQATVVGGVLDREAHPTHRQAHQSAAQRRRPRDEEARREEPPEQYAGDVGGGDAARSGAAAGTADRLQDLLDDPLPDHLVQLALRWCRPRFRALIELVAFLLQLLERRRLGDMLEHRLGQLRAHVHGLEHDGRVAADGQVEHVLASRMLEVGDIVNLTPDDHVPARRLRELLQRLILIFCEVRCARWHPLHLDGKQVHHRELIGDLQPSVLPTLRRLAEPHHKGVQQARVELHELPPRNPRLEWVPEPERGPQVVRVHDDVRQRVDPRPVAHRPVPDAGTEEVPPHAPDRGVVVHMKEGHLVALLLHDDPERVDPIQHLAQVVDEDEPLARLVVLAANAEDVRKADAGHKPPHHVGAHHDLQDVIDLHRALHIERWPGGHVAREGIDEEDPRDRHTIDDDRVHERIDPRLRVEPHCLRGVL
mmetsp:Transcript_86233/g.249036  ORF Transcript_86233/g.249036 Transcript_86233/m.249036 type:complete len:552 (+) Transcript_86233:514-2169(+)